MRQARIKKERGTAVYHCISRVVGRAFLLDEEAKTKFRKMVWEVADFCGVEVLAYCLMDNHFHLLVRVPEKSAEGVTREEVLRRYGVLYAHSNTPGYPDAARLRSIFEQGSAEEVEEWMGRLTARMEDVSEYMKTLKQRFTMWFNKRHQRVGTVWTERFKSVLVQDDPSVVRTVAGYIDLNPVRAGVVEDPATYAWCSYGEAMNGEERAQKGLASGFRAPNWTQAGAVYQRILRGKVGRRAENWQKLKEAEDGRETEGQPEDLSALGEVLRGRCRELVDGKVLGSATFVGEGPTASDGGKTEATDHATPARTLKEPWETGLFCALRGRKAGGT